MDESERRYFAKGGIFGGLIGAVLGLLCLPLLTYLTVVFEIPLTLDLVLLLGFAPFGYIALVCVIGAFFGVIGAVVGTGIAENSDRN